MNLKFGRHAHLKLGKLGEKLAKIYLLEMGFEILDTNFTGDDGEIDLIARKNGVLHFVEVKTRRRRHDWQKIVPSEAVTAAKKKCIIKTAFYFRQKCALQQVAYQYDIIEIVAHNFQKFEALYFWSNAFGEINLPDNY